jgi:prenyltransferase beta subunit|tara:strand:- start:265 stop:459 length:195 start_codon:yes stop_codon:yes gene_type:complete
MNLKILTKLNQISEELEDLIEKEQSTWYSDRQLSSSDLRDLEKVLNLLLQIIQQKPLKLPSLKK